MTTYVEYEAGEAKIIATMFTAFTNGTIFTDAKEIVWSLDCEAVLRFYMQKNGESLANIRYAEFQPDYWMNLNDDHIWIGSWEDLMSYEVVLWNKDTVQNLLNRTNLQLHYVPRFIVWTDDYCYTSHNMDRDSVGLILQKKLSPDVQENNRWRWPTYSGYTSWKNTVPEPQRPA